VDTSFSTAYEEVVASPPPKSPSLHKKPRPPKKIREPKNPGYPDKGRERSDPYISNVISSFLRANCSFIFPSVAHNPMPYYEMYDKLSTILGVTDEDAQAFSKKINVSYNNIRTSIKRIEERRIVDPMHQIFIMHASKELLNDLGISRKYILRWRKACMNVHRLMGRDKKRLFILFLFSLSCYPQQILI
jgi:hypothetical protein